MSANIANALTDILRTWHPAGRYRRTKNAAKKGLAAPEQIQGYYAYVQLAFGMGAFVWTIKAF